VLRFVQLCYAWIDLICGFVPLPVIRVTGFLNSCYPPEFVRSTNL